MSDTGMTELRQVVNLFNGINESFNERFTAEELLMLARMCWASEYDITPDRWTAKQIQLALKGKVPCWEEKDGETVPVIAD